MIEIDLTPLKKFRIKTIDLSKNNLWNINLEPFNHTNLPRSGSSALRPKGHALTNLNLSQNKLKFINLSSFFWIRKFVLERSPDHSLLKLYDVDLEVYPSLMRTNIAWRLGTGPALTIVTDPTVNFILPVNRSRGLSPLWPPRKENYSKTELIEMVGQEPHTELLVELADKINPRSRTTVYRLRERAYELARTTKPNKYASHFTVETHHVVKAYEIYQQELSEVEKKKFTGVLFESAKHTISQEEILNYLLRKVMPNLTWIPDTVSVKNAKKV